MIVQRLDGTTFNLTDLGFRGRLFVIPSPLYRNNTQQIQGRNGLADLATTFGERKMTLKGRFTANDLPDAALLRDVVFGIFNSLDPFYVIDDEREPGKRWLVRVDGSFDYSEVYVYGDVEVPLICARGFSESLGRTDSDAIDFNNDLWQAMGAGIDLSDDLAYTFGTASFSVYNGGDLTIDPAEEHELDITFTGASSGLQIENATTGDLFTYDGDSEDDESIELSGVKALKSGVSIFTDTNYGLITLKPGWNDITVSGATGDFTIKFGFRYYYLANAEGDLADAASANP